MSTKKILIVDDSLTDLLKLKELVASAGCAIVTAGSGAEAVNKAKTEQPDMIFMDVVMEEVDGFKACRTISNDPVTRDIPVVFVSSKHSRADKLWAEKQGGKALVTKPYTDDQILEQINAFT